MKIAIVTDAWKPQVNGVVTTLQRTRETLEARGHTSRPSRSRTRSTSFARALDRTWDRATAEFMSHLARIDGAGTLFYNLVSDT